MKNELRLYRKHKPACEQGHKKAIFDGDTSVLDCQCPINAIGYLKRVVNSHGAQKRIQHKSVDTTDWQVARQITEQWLLWEGFAEPLKDEDLVSRHDVTIDQAVSFFFRYSSETHTKGDAAREKYAVLLNRRMKPFFTQKKKLFIREFDEAVFVKTFFMSWINLQPRRGKKMSAMDTKKALKLNTKRAELERYRTFLEFCRDNGWLQFNHAKKIKLGNSKVAPKFAFTLDEYEKILSVVDQWKDRYKTNQRTVRLRAFVRALRYLGQRVSDTMMLGPNNLVNENGKGFVVLTQIKSGNLVKIPATSELIKVLDSLPILGETDQPFVLHRAGYDITYGTRFWFWTANIPKGADNEQINQIVESASKNWCDDIVSVLAKTQKEHGKFKHHATPHSFRHFFAITMLQSGVKIEQVSKWLGHSSPLITARHYSHANSDWHDASHSAFMTALDALEKPRTKLVQMKRVG